MFVSTVTCSRTKVVFAIPNNLAPQVRDTWAFDAASLPAQDRASAWAGAMRRLQLPFAEPAQNDGAVGTVRAITTPMGFEFALVTGGPQTIAGSIPGAAAGLWLGLLVEGTAWLETRETQVQLSPETLIYGATGVDASLRFDGPFRQLFLRIPSVAIDARMLAPLARKVSIIEPGTIVRHALLALLHSVYASLEQDRPGGLAPIETALIELIVPIITHSGGVAAKGGMAALRVRQFERICRMIESQLGDPEMTVQTIARAEGVSVRYLQQLFARSGQTVSAYVKARRLERARADLINPLHIQLNISEIGFRWGFNQSAHFSRTYRERFGEAPRQTRSVVSEPADGD